MLLKTPNITPAQIIAVIGAAVVEAVDVGLVSGHTSKVVVGLAGVLVPFALTIADAIIRHGRSRALTPTASATVQTQPQQTPPA